MGETHQRSEAGVRMLTQFVNGKPLAGTGDRHGDVFDPAFGKVSAPVPLASVAEVDAAVAAAQAAFPAWAGTAPIERARILFTQRWPHSIVKGAEFTMPVAT